MPDGVLQPEQREIIRLFFSLPESHGFDLGVFQQALRSISRFRDSELPCEANTA